MHLVQKPFLISLRVIPDKIHTQLISCCINHLLRGQELKKRLRELEGKSVCINIKDAQTRFHFLIQGGHLKPSSYNISNVTITGNTTDFWQLATHQEDPDTLFFRRSLNIEGETETGVHIKNIMDSLEYDWDAHFDDVLLPPIARIAKRLADKARLINKRHRYHSST
ncbi:MAG: SCP2 sterol-binding domain-containing protein [Gammaproteobacteria bacterium]|nr:SCP2 sterol-binding domain-containing protein [Gammaproteobacteria bacterium]